MTPLRCFFAHRAQAGEDAINTTLAWLRSALAGALPGVEVEVVAGRDDYREHFHRAGGWDGWARDVGAGTRFADREPRYHVIISPDRAVGRATAQIIEYALGEQKPVLCVPAGEPAFLVCRVGWTGEDNWKSAWILHS